MADRPTKADLEQKLKEKADAISSRMSKLENSLPGSGIKIPEAMKSRRNLRIGAAVGAGFLVGYLLINRKRRGSRSNYSDQLGHLADRLGDAIADRMRNDMGTNDAVRDALEEVPPMVELQSGKVGVIGSSLQYLLKTGGSILASELTRWLQDGMVEERKHPPGEAD